MTTTTLSHHHRHPAANTTTTPQKDDVDDDIMVDGCFYDDNDDDDGPIPFEEIDDGDSSGSAISTSNLCRCRHADLLRVSRPGFAPIKNLANSMTLNLLFI